MSSNAYLALLFVCVIVGLAAGLAGAFWIGSIADGAAFAFAGGVGTIVVTFGCCAAGILVMYGLASQIDRIVRSRGKAERAQKKELKKKRSRKKRRKKR